MEKCVKFWNSKIKGVLDTLAPLKFPNQVKKFRGKIGNEIRKEMIKRDKLKSEIKEVKNDKERV